MLRLKELREVKGISQKELANYLNLTQVQISKYELGKNEPDLSTTKKIATYFNVTIDYLLGTPEEDIILISKDDFKKFKEVSEIIQRIDKVYCQKDEPNIKNSFNHFNNNGHINIGNGSINVNSKDDKK